VTGGWRKLHNEELHNLYSSPSIIRMIKSKRMKTAGHVARMGETRKAKTQWVDNIKMDLREIGWDGRDWIHLAQNRDHWRALVNTVMNLRVP
jgi:trehalose/maltose hydrolase-like predicted phosphorylase